MSTPPAGTVRADPDALNDLATRLGHVRTDLAGDTADFDAEGTLHSPLIEQELRAFAAAWTQRRSNLVDFLGACEQRLHTAASEFRAADEQLAGALGTEKPAR
jgi:hypothetical protein